MPRPKTYFPREPEGPAPLSYTTPPRRARFGEVDAMAVMWHGHYAGIFEEAASELRRLAGMGYDAFHGVTLHAPIIQLHVDYRISLRLDEFYTCRARWIYSEAARINIEYTVLNADETIVATGYTVQLFVDPRSPQPRLTVPPLMLTALERWEKGELKDLQCES